MTRSDYEARARAPWSQRTGKYSTNPESRPLARTAFEPGKRSRHERQRSDESSSSAESSTASESESGTDPDEEAERGTTPRPRYNNLVIYLCAGIVVVLLFGAAMFVYHTRFATSESNVTDSNLPEPSAENDRAASFARAPDAAAHTTSSSLAGPSESRTKSEPEDSEGANASASSLTPTSTDSVAKGKNNAPSGYDQVTLAGTFVDTASYAVATGSAGYVGDELANADMTKLQKEPNNKLAQDKQGKIWIGDVTFYAAGKGGTGSCGTNLYDGQDLYFAAMSVQDLMGSASPAPFCYSCISLQNVKDPSKTITAIVADSCPACTLAHVDLEQKAFFALGATVDMGVLTVAWSFIDCPEGWSKEAMEAISDDVYEAVKSR